MHDGIHVILDDASHWLPKRTEFVALLNAYRRTGAFVRVKEKDEKGRWGPPVPRLVWAGLAIGLIGSLPPEIADRCLTITMKRVKPARESEPGENNAALAPVRDALAAWVPEARLESARDLPASLQSRRRELYSPLYQVAASLGDPFGPARLTKAIASFEPGDTRTGTNAGLALLSRATRVFREEGTDRLQPTDLLKHLAELFPDYYSDGFSCHQIRELLREFTNGHGEIIVPRSTRDPKESSKVRRFYFAADFTEALREFGGEAEAEDGWG
jgi:hypothetical protein